MHHTRPPPRRATCIHEAGWACGGVQRPAASVRFAWLAVAAAGGEDPASTDILADDALHRAEGTVREADLVLPRQFLRWLMERGLPAPGRQGGHHSCCGSAQKGEQVEKASAPTSAVGSVQMVG